MSQCAQYPFGKRCPNMGEGWIIQPDGKRNPGGYSCRTCADESAEEYRQKLGESWSFEPEIRCYLIPLTGKASAGQWDWHVVAERTEDRAVLSEKISGGRALAESVLRGLARRLAV